MLSTGNNKDNKILSSFSAIFIMVALSVVGIAAIPQLNICFLPEEKGPELLIRYSMPNASSAFIEAEVTSKLEAALGLIRSCTKIESYSRKGGGEICLTFRGRTSMEASRFEVASVIRNIYSSLPEGLSYPSISRSAIQSRQNRQSLIYTLKGPLPTKEIERYARLYLLPPVSSLAEVNSVLISGASPWQWVITYDAKKAAAAGISGEDIAKSITNNRGNDMLGYVFDGNNRISIRLITDVADNWGDIPIKQVDGRIYHLEDIASWRSEEKEPSYYHRVNGLNTITLSIGFIEGSNLIRAVDEVREKMKSLQNKIPPDLSLSVSYDASSFMREELKKNFFRTLFCIILLLILVLLASSSWRYLFVIAVTLAVNISIPIGLYAILHIPVHIYTLAGISVSLGIVIDTTIVMTNHYMYWHNRTIFPAILSATLTTLSALSVTFLLPNAARTNLSDFILVIILNLTVSLLIAYLFVPAIVPQFPVRNNIQSRSWQLKLLRFRHSYSRYIIWAVHHKWVVLIVTLSLMTGPTYLFIKHLDQATFNRQPIRPQLLIHAGMPEGCTISQLNEVVQKMELYLASFDGIESFTTHILSAEDAYIVVDFDKERERSSLPLLIKQAVISQAKVYGGAEWFVSGLDDSFFNNTPSNSITGYIIRLSGYQYPELLRYADVLLHHLYSNSRLISETRIMTTGISNMPGMEYRWKEREDKLLISDITPSQYFASLFSHLSNKRVGAFYDENGSSDIILRSSTNLAQDLWFLQHNSLPADSTNIHLASWTEIDKVFSDRDIHRVNQTYQLDVFFSYKGGGSAGRNLTHNAVEHMNQNIMPPGYKAENITNNMSETQTKDYSWLIGIAIAIIFLILSICFESLTLPIAILSLVPFSFLGLFLVFLIFNLRFDQGGYAALIMLCGLSVNAGIYLVATFLRHGGKDSLHEKQKVHLYVKAFSERIYPILLTLSSTILGLLPFLIYGPDEVFWFDFAAGAIGGLLFSLLGLLFLMPALVISRHSSRESL